MDYTSVDEYYAIVPEWVIDLPISAQAVRLYAVLNRYADKDDGTCFPAIATLARRMHTSNSTVKRALNELKKCGAVFVEPRYNAETKNRLATCILLCVEIRSYTNNPQSQMTRRAFT